MTQTTTANDFRAFRVLPKDIGVLIVLAAALVLAQLFRIQQDSRTTLFQDKDTPFAMAFPATWGRMDTPAGYLIRVENPRTKSVFKTFVQVEARGLDLDNPPTVQQLVDRRVRQQGTLTAHHLLAQPSEEQVGGTKAMRVEYAYVVQPIDEARRASLPVVVHALEYVVVTKANVFYITLAAPDSEFGAASEEFEEIIEKVKVQ